MVPWKIKAGLRYEEQGEKTVFEVLGEKDGFSGAKNFNGVRNSKLVSA